jgi:hypothetical protein
MGSSLHTAIHAAKVQAFPWHSHMLALGILASILAARTHLLTATNSIG